MSDAGVSQNRGRKFDLQLSQALIDERRLGEIFACDKIVRPNWRVELKSESWLWEQTGNICVEFRQNGEPSGVAITDADWWVHELKRDGATLVYLMFPIERLKALARRAYAEGRYREGVGDGGRFGVVLIPLSWITRDE
jgi:hypothetical protein